MITSKIQTNTDTTETKTSSNLDIWQNQFCNSAKQFEALKDYFSNIIQNLGLKKLSDLPGVPSSPNYSTPAVSMEEILKSLVIKFDDTTSALTTLTPIVQGFAEGRKTPAQSKAAINSAATRGYQISLILKITATFIQESLALVPKTLTADEINADLQEPLGKVKALLDATFTDLQSAQINLNTWLRSASPNTPPLDPETVASTPIFSN
jgi:hypothetical protein